MTDLSESEILLQFRDAMAAMGLRTSDKLEPYDGEVRRFNVDGDPKGTRNGWYVLFMDGIPAGEFGSWRSGVQATWTANGDRLTADEAREVRERIEAARKKREADTRAKQGEAARAANLLLNAAQPANDDHPYLTRKRVRAHGLAVADWPLRNSDGEVYGHVAGTLLVPIMDARGRVVSLQGIFPEKRGTFGRDKDFLKDGRKRGCFHLIGKPVPGKPVAIAEGYATAATVHELTGWCVAVAFDAYNLRPVAEALREVMPGELFVICADNDQWTETPVKNPGITEATKAGQAINARVLVPEFADDDGRPTDWNDLAQREGADVALRQLQAFMIQVPAPAANDNAPVDVHGMRPVDFMSWPHMGTSGRPLNTIPNLQYLLANYGFTVRYDVIRKDLAIAYPGQSGTPDNQRTKAVDTVGSLCALNRLPKTDIKSFLLSIGDENPRNPVMDFITSKPWDTRSRLADLLETIKTRPGFDRHLLSLLLRRWLISAVAAAAKPSGFWSKGVLVFQGEQSLGKTAWFRALLPYAMRDLLKVDATINPDNKDSIISAVSHWLVELGELDGTLRKADIARLKGFISQDVDQFRRPYGHTEEKFPRRTVFFASVNPEQFLADDTGNVRWWTVPVADIDHLHGIDMQQVWAEVFEWFKKGERWWLDRDEEARLEAGNAAHRRADPIEELILSRYDCGTSATRRLTATEILIELGYDKPTKAMLNEAGNVLRRRFGDAKKSNGRKVFEVPYMDRERPF